jgi:2-oxo-3-hexenedioate decarboxylase
VTDPHALAAELIEAERTRTPIPALTRRYPFLDLRTAYQVQALVVADRGDRLIGAKLGLTSAVKRRALGIHEPVHGRLTAGMVVAEGEPVRLSELIHPRAEPEIAFVMGRRLEGAPTVAQVLGATDAILPAIEIMDSRYSTAFRLADSVADNAGAARVVLGTRPRRPGELPDLSVLGCVFRGRGGIETAAGGAAMGHPAAAVAWLVRQLDAIEEGSIVLSGGLTASMPLERRSVVVAEFDGLGPVLIGAV